MTPTASPQTSLAPSASPSGTPDTQGARDERSWLIPLAVAAALGVGALLAAKLFASQLAGLLKGMMSGLAGPPPAAGSPSVGGELNSEGAETAVLGGQKKVSDEVQCTVFAPLRVSPGDSLLVQVFAHLAEQARQLARLAKDADEDAARRDTVPLDEPVERGQELFFQLTMDGLDVREPTLMRLVWQGKPRSVKFEVHVPDDCPPQDFTGTVDIYRLNTPIGNLRFKLKVVPRAQAAVEPTSQTVPEQKFNRYRYAFISYASEDRAEVLRRVQVLPLVEINYFQDITSLDPGDRWEKELYKEIDKCDVFFLFWSKAARDSKWVEKEVLYALENRHGEDGAAPAIKPVMLEGPPPVPPPERLRSLHFNDKMLYFISVEDSLRAVRKGGTPDAAGADEKGA